VTGSDKQLPVDDLSYSHMKPPKAPGLIPKLKKHKTLVLLPSASHRSHTLEQIPYTAGTFQAGKPSNSLTNSQTQHSRSADQGMAEADPIMDEREEEEDRGHHSQTGTDHAQSRAAGPAMHGDRTPATHPARCAMSAQNAPRIQSQYIMA